MAQGYKQKYGIDYEHMFSPVVKMTTVCTSLVVASTKRWSLHEMDVKNAFLHEHLKETVCIEPPLVYSLFNPNLLYKFCKLLYVRSSLLMHDLRNFVLPLV